jgi:hypothetical protein
MALLRCFSIVRRIEDHHDVVVSLFMTAFKHERRPQPSTDLATEAYLTSP